MKRRDFLKKTSQAVTLAAISSATGLFFYERNRGSDLPNLFPEPLKTTFEVPPQKDLPHLTLCRNEDHLTALRAGLDEIGGIKRFVKTGEKVTIKPNVGWDRRPEQAANTNPVLVGEMVRQCYAAGASEVIVSDVTCNDPRRCFIRSGIRDAAEEAGAKVLLAEEQDYIEINLGGKLLTTWPVLKHFVETDRFINMPIVKHHSLSACTIGMKNLYGIIGGRRNQLHQQIDQSIVDLTAFVRPTLTVVDATRVLMRSGPQGGSLADVNTEHTVLCATDPVTADARGAEFLGLNPANVSHIMLAESSGLGTADYHKAGYKEISV